MREPLNPGWKAAICLLALLWLAAPVASTAEIQNSACLDCHADKSLTTTNAAGREISLFADVTKLAASVHRTNTCASCHADITAKHPDDDVVALPVNCSKCHAGQGVSYEASVHGLSRRAGDKGAATCADCHDSHLVLPPSSPQSPLHFSNLGATCGACHDEAARDVAQSIHGTSVAAGNRDAPTCTDCHSEHKIEGLKTSSPMKISMEVCSKCHGSERMNTKFNLPADRVKTFFESYHGLAAQYGSTLAANCASCHGYHKIFPSNDPRSATNPRNLVQTCGQCHPGATAGFALGKVHVDSDEAGSAASGTGEKINWWVRKLYRVLIVAVIGAMLLHNGLALAWKLAAIRRSSDRSVTRMNPVQRLQHALLAVSFIVLAVTGFALKFPDSWLARLLGSSEPFRRWTHRIAGVILIVVGVFHLAYALSTRDGRRLVRDFMPSLQDVRDVVLNLRYYAGLSRKKARIGRFGYAEKLEYWAVVWGSIIMGATGFVVWFKIYVTRFLPRWAVDVAVSIHYYEAILACLAILVWHFYHVIFDPDVYPLNWACWDGQVSKQWHEEEHPLDEPAEPQSEEIPPVTSPSVDVGL